MKSLLAVLGAAVLLAGCAGGPRIDTRYSSVGHDSRVQFIVVHYTSSDFARSLSILSGGDVSSHYLIDQAPPTIYRLVDENRRAWHAGESEWRGRTWLNATSIGIELVNAGYQDSPGGRIWQPYPDEQIDQLIVLLKDIMARHGLKSGAVIGHSDIAPQRKVDPGPAFPWKRLADAGLIPWPAPEQQALWQQHFALAAPDIFWWQQALARFGYRVPQHGELDEATRNVIAAFQMRYRPARHDGEPDIETAAILAALDEQAAPR